MQKFNNFLELWEKTVGEAVLCNNIINLPNFWEDILENDLNQDLRLDCNREGDFLYSFLQDDFKAICESFLIDILGEQKAQGHINMINNKDHTIRTDAAFEILKDFITYSKSKNKLKESFKDLNEIEELRNCLNKTI